MNEIKLSKEIFSRFGTIKRARGNFLYTAKGVRLTDLFLEGGRAVLGWGSDNSKCWTIFKNIISRGITGSYITDFNAYSKDSFTTQLDRSISFLLNSERKTYIFNNKEEALKTAININQSSVSVYKPWAWEDTKIETVECVVIASPLAWAQNIWILAVKRELNTLVLDQIKSLVLPAPLEAALIRSVWDLIKVIQNRSEKDWFIYDKILTKYWTRKGPWLFPKVKEDDYQNFVLHCLDCNIVISPFYTVPSIVPYGADFGVFKKLEKNPFTLNQ